MTVYPPEVMDERTPGQKLRTAAMWYSGPDHNYDPSKELNGAVQLQDNDIVLVCTDGVTKEALEQLAAGLRTTSGALEPDTVIAKLMEYISVEDGVSAVAFVHHTKPVEKIPAGESAGGTSSWPWGRD